VAPQPSYTPPQPARTGLAPAQLIVRATGAALPLPAAQQAVIGRSDAVSNFFPDIDLTGHGALEGGVGRRHVRLFVQGGQLMAEDLDSVNGSALNGQKLAPRQPRPLNTGDMLTLGRVALEVRL
jgi:pSer/pThr/pTyr-binding forkhead associated (FHA) protein